MQLKEINNKLYKMFCKTIINITLLLLLDCLFLFDNVTTSSEVSRMTE